VRRVLRRERDRGARDGAGHGAVPPVVRPAHLREAVGQARVHPSREPCTRRPDQIEQWVVKKKIARQIVRAHAVCMYVCNTGGVAGV